ncbi:hypothetical protein MNV49_007888 [Pseudohyphozyma bogoriensis]|nr:hypothetical protein MNV49_007888 [Pseudohyphozyma bogoriensis]
MSSFLARLVPSSSPSTSATTPAFLSQPLTSQTVFNAISDTLSEREEFRHWSAHDAYRRARATPQSHAAAGREQEVASRYATLVGLSPGHVKKNRYTDIIAYDRTRLLLPSEPDDERGTVDEGDEYVNASLVVEPDLGLGDLLPRRWWVASQAPIASTIHTFLSLLLHAPRSPSHPEPLPLVSVILQLTPLKEQRRDKCHPYFPEDVGDSWTVPPKNVNTAKKGITVKLVSKETNRREQKRVSVLEVGWEGEEARQVTHVEYLAWGDHGVPENPQEILDFIQSTTALNNSLSSPTNPAPFLIHCSAGKGSTDLPPYPTSVFSSKIERDFVGETIDGLREQRTTMVQTVGQVMWCYQALEAAWKGLGEGQ